MADDAISAVRGLRLEKTYILRRIPRVREEIKALVDERKELSRRRKSAASPQEAKDVRENHIYTRRRLQILQTELKDLMSNKRETKQKLRTSKSAESQPKI
jgi:hypothetical protein